MPEVERHRRAGHNLTGGCIAVRIVADDAVRIAMNGGASMICASRPFSSAVHTPRETVPFSVSVFST